MLLEYIFLFLLGLSIGSFLTVVAERFDTTESFWRGRSHCNQCNKLLSWWELIPLAGYLLLHGKCRHCQTRIPITYLFFELLAGLTFIGLRGAQNEVNYWVLGGQLIIASLLIILFIYDWYYQSFPLSLIVLTFFTTLIISSAIIYFAPSHRSTFSFSDPMLAWLSSPYSLWGALIKGSLIGVIALAIFAFPSKGKWMGYGDVWLAGILGLWLGYPLVIIGLMLAFYLGAIVAIWQIITRRVAGDRRIAFGPFLIAGAIIVQVWGSLLFTSIIKIWGVI